MLRPISIGARLLCVALAILMTVLLAAAPGCISSALAKEEPAAPQAIPPEVLDELARDLSGLYQAVIDAAKTLERSDALPAPPAGDPAVALFETYTMRAGNRADWLWNRFRAEGRPAHEWPAFWRAACAASDIPCTEEAWRRIPAGTRITMLRSPEDIRRDIAAARERWERSRDERASIVAQERANIATLEEQLALYRAVAVILGAVAAILFVGMLLIAAKNHRLEIENTKKRDEYERQGRDLRRTTDERDRLQGDVTRLIAHLSARAKESRGEPPLTPPRTP